MPLILKTKKLFTYFKWLVAFASIFFLIYKLSIYDYPTNFWSILKSSFSNNFPSLVLTLLLLPFNIGAETIKWKILTRKTENISFGRTLQSVLAGLSTGFISPNRTGEFVGRSIYFMPVNRRSIIALSFASGIVQNFVIAAFGLFAIFFGAKAMFVGTVINVENYIEFIVAILMISLALIFYMPKVMRRIGKNSVFDLFFKGLATLNNHDLMLLILFSCIRYLIFCCQFYAVLCFFDINISMANATLAIPLYYLLVSFTPTIAFAEATVRSSYAIVVLGSFANHNVALLAMAGFSIWMINFVTPMLLFFIKNFFYTLRLKPTPRL